MSEVIKDTLASLFYQWSGENPSSIIKLPVSGSNRIYYRLTSKNYSVIGAANKDNRENKAFFYLSEYFRNLNLPVPEIFAITDNSSCYLQSDLGDITLFSLLEKQTPENRFNKEIIDLYKSALNNLLLFQTTGNKNLDYSYCYPRPSFDKQSVMWDLNYFKYYFLKLSDIDFDEQLLENDFNSFSDFLLEADRNFFLYRDFQSRNIMIKDETPWFIDYQGGRKGALQYDVASLLYDAKADIPENIKKELLDYYLNILVGHTEISKESFLRYFNAYAGIRIMQALGAYGFRGLYEKKQHFIKSIPYGIKNLNSLLTDDKTWNKFPYLAGILSNLCSYWLSKSGVHPSDGILKVSVHSFSYKKGIPVDETDNGGGFVFDCRALPNPGRFEKYRCFTGLDAPVIEFLEREPEVIAFLEKTRDLVLMSINNYKDRSFTNLKVCFGCTGGQHRSVYLASKFAESLKEIDGIHIITRHEQLVNY